LGVSTFGVDHLCQSSFLKFGFFQSLIVRSVSQSDGHADEIRQPALRLFEDSFPLNEDAQSVRHARCLSLGLDEVVPMSTPEGFPVLLHEQSEGFRYATVVSCIQPTPRLGYCVLHRVPHGLLALVNVLCAGRIGREQESFAPICLDWGFVMILSWHEH
jgi:hypothetical protein